MNNKVLLINSLLSLSVQTWMLISIGFEVYRNCIDQYAKVDAILLFTCGILALSKMTCFRIYADNLISNFNSAINDYLTIDNEEKRVVMRRHAVMGRMICYGVTCVAYVAASFYMFWPLVTSDNVVQVNGTVVSHNAKYPIPSTCTLGSLPISTTLHVVLFVLQCTVIFIIANGNLGNEPILGALMLFTRTTIY